MRSSQVVVVDELGQDILEVPPAEDQQLVETLAPDRAHPALSERVGARAPVGRPGYADAFAAEDLVEGGGELGVAIVEQELHRERAFSDLPGQVASLLGDPVAGRMERAAGEMDAAAADLDEEEDVELGQPDGVDDEEVGGEEVIAVLADELPPGAMAATGSGREAVAAEQASNGEVGAAPAELEDLALDTTVAPARVLASDAEDQLAELVPGGRAPGRA